MREMVTIVNEENKLPYEEFKKKREIERKTPDKSKMVEMVKVVPEKDKEHKEYLICITFISDGDYEWNIIKGRKNTYEYIKDMIEYIDVDESFVLVEHLTLDKRISVYKFMKYAQDSYNDGFDIDEVVFVSSEDNNLIPEPNRENLSMESIMNGEVGMMELE